MRSSSNAAPYAFRTIPAKVLSLEELNAPRVFGVTDRPRGLICGVLQSGSSPSRMVTSAERCDRVLTIEIRSVLQIEVRSTREVGLPLSFASWQRVREA
jgi:Tfp pilus assembly pilus retraction ATPase PilT